MESCRVVISRGGRSPVLLRTDLKGRQSARKEPIGLGIEHRYSDKQEEDCWAEDDIATRGNTA